MMWSRKRFFDNEDDGEKAMETRLSVNKHIYKFKVLNRFNGL